MVTHQVLHLSGCNAANELGEVEESVVTLCVFRSHLLRQDAVKLTCDPCSVDHFALGLARMDLLAGDRDESCSCVEVLVLDLADRAAVYSVSALNAESRNVEVVCSAADLLVRGKTKCDLAVLDRRVVQQTLCHRHDLGNSGFVVSAEE